MVIVVYHPHVSKSVWASLSRAHPDERHNWFTGFILRVANTPFSLTLDIVPYFISDTPALRPRSQAGITS